jgi:hypothetical protein
VHDADDFNIMVKSQSPLVIEFLNNCFIENRFTKSITNVDISKDSEGDAMLHESHAIESGSLNEQGDVLINKHVKVVMCDIGWVYNETSSNSQPKDLS